MSTQQIAVVSLVSSLPGSQRCDQKPSLDEKLDRFFQVAEHVDAKCAHYVATHWRHGAPQPRRHGYK
jgi:hypothetical protein